MIRKWLIDLIQEALYAWLTGIERKLDQANIDLAAIRSAVQNLVDSYQAKVYTEDNVGEGNTGEEVQPIAQARSSWPRMKKHFEEREIRNIIAQQNQASEEFTATRRDFNREADRVASYWQNKQQKGI